MRVKYDINTKYSCQIGYPLAHSCAAYVHNRMYEVANLNAVCLSVEVKDDALADFIAANKAMGMTGFDITSPHKSKIIEYLDECDEPSRVFQCVNHVKWVDGKLIGVGLDGVGMSMAIESEGISIKGTNVMIIGGGAVAGAIAADLCERGAECVRVVNRTISKAEYIVENLKRMYGVKAYAFEMTDEIMKDVAEKSDLVVQCTMLGMAGHKEDFENVDFIDSLPENAVVTDVLYPRTKVLDAAQERGLKIINGMGMLAQQQLAMMKFRFDIDMPSSSVKDAEEALYEAVAMREMRLKK